jgi:flagellar hook-length control protein FliK
MEALPSLPPELVAFVAPMAREPASLLGSADADTESTGAALPFDLYLALLTAPPTAGEAWPASGKDLPAATPFAVAAPQTAGLPATSANDAALLARLNLAASDAGARLQGAAPLPMQNADALAAPLPATSTQHGLLGQDAAPPPTITDPAAAMPAEIAEALPAESAELAAHTTPADSAEGAMTLEPAAAPDARAPRAQPLTEQQLAAPTHTRSALGAQDGRPVEAHPRGDGTPQIEVTKLSQPLIPAVAETAHAGTEWLPTSHTATSATQASTAQSAAAGPPVDLRAPNWQEAFASRVQWLTGSNGGEARITLNPPELGAVDVKVSLVDDKTYVQLTTATAAARDELSQSLPRLRELFAASGIELGGASVHDGGHGNRAGYGGDRPASAPESRLPAPFAELADEPPAAAIPRRSLGRVDVFA